MIQAVTFDVTHTLIHAPHLGDLYSEVLRKHRVEIDPPAAERLVSQVWQELACSADPGRDRFANHPEGERGWWRRFLERMCEHLEAPIPSRFAAAELFHRFGTAEAWEVYPEVPGVLAELAGQGLRLGVVSNWDHRLPGVLEELGIAHFFGAITYSQKAGVEKPDPRIFLQALAALEVEPAAALHVGDGKLEDGEGAVAAGMSSLLLARQGTGVDLRDLSSLPARLASGRAGWTGRRPPDPVLDF
ncbi:MAG TPA: HAD-IA family hydrolase [Thermoanaerobaculia bacterium]|nr:HAD-IA family hydrolase [Thermoanaerobaculia bacterium]